MAASQEPDFDGEVVLLVTDQPSAPVIHRAQVFDLPVVSLQAQAYESRSAFEAVLLKQLAYYQVDVLLLAGFMRLLTAEFVAHYAGRILNIHPAFLPEFPGAHAMEDALAAGAKETGVTIHLVDAGMDSGPILAQERVLIEDGDTLATLAPRIHAVEHVLYPKTVKRYLRERQEADHESFTECLP